MTVPHSSTFVTTNDDQYPLLYAVEKLKYGTDPRFNNLTMVKIITLLPRGNSFQRDVSYRFLAYCMILHPILYEILNDEPDTKEYRIVLTPNHPASFPENLDAIAGWAEREDRDEFAHNLIDEDEEWVAGLRDLIHQLGIVDFEAE
jgi:hypothetical protein